MTIKRIRPLISTIKSISTIKRFKLFALILSTFFIAAWAQANVKPEPVLMQPTISPDGSQIAFAANSAIWIVPASGGTAHILVANGATNYRPLFSPDGEHLVFVSDKTGNGDIYKLNLNSGTLTRLTFADSRELPSAFSADGKWLYFTSTRGNIGGMSAVYHVRITGGTPMPVALELYRNIESGAPSRDGKKIALVGLGWGSAQWWRDGHSHIDETAIWVLKNGSHMYRKLTPGNARALWPMWGQDGKSIYYMSDRSGTENIWKVNLNGMQTPVTNFTNGRCLWPTISADSKTIVFQRGFDIWKLNTVSGVTSKVPITLGSVIAGPGIEHKTFSSGFSDLVLSLDGKKLAFIVHGEVFATRANRKKDVPAQQITYTAAAEFGIEWSPDSRSIIYVSERGDVNHIYQYNFVTGEEKRLTNGNKNDSQPRFSPNGKSVAFIRGAESLKILNLSSGELRTIASGNLSMHHPLNATHSFEWSPDGRWIAFLAWGERMYKNVKVVPVNGGEARYVSFLGNTFSGSLHWSPDGKSLYFSTGQRTKTGRIARVNLVPITPKFRKEKFFNLFREETPPTPPSTIKKASVDKSQNVNNKKKGKLTEPVNVNFDNIARRTKLLPVGLNVGSITLSPDGNVLVFGASVAGNYNLYTWSLDPLDSEAPVAKQITSTNGYKSSVQFSPDGETVWYLSGGKIYSVSVSDGNPKLFQTSAAMDINFDKEKMVVFHQVWQWLDDNFHDSNMNGVNWKAVRKRYKPLVAGATTPETLHRILRRMVGELNASHLGVSRDEYSKEATGHLGLRFYTEAYEKHGNFKVRKVIPLGPAAVTGKIAPGDYILAINDKKIGVQANIYKLLLHDIGKKTILTVANSPDGANSRKVEVKPVSSSTITHLTYQMWTEHNREIVNKLSNGKLGYIHIPDMSLSSLHRLYRSINAINGTKKGVVIDIRNNFGGFVSAYALDALAREHYLNMTMRGMNTVSARSVLGQRALERPTVLITNRVTLSDGEDFTAGYRELDLGKVVGEPTAGWIIFTWNVRLINGSVVRLPASTITTVDGEPMEMNPRPVDTYVADPLGGRYHNKYPRLKAAVEVLLDELAEQK